MNDILSNPLAWIFGSIAIMTIVSAAASFGTRYYRDQLDARLKMEMIRAGMKADDIVKVLAARSTKSGGTKQAEGDSC